MKHEWYCRIRYRTPQGVRDYATNSPELYQQELRRLRELGLKILHKRMERLF